MITDADVPEPLLDLIYDAASEQELWQRLLRDIAVALDSPGGILFGVSFAEARILYEHNGGLCEEANRVYKARHMHNPWHGHMQHRAIGEVVPSAEVMDLPALRRTAFFDEVLRPQQLAHSAMIPLAAPPSLVAAFNIVRGDRQGPYAERELAFLRRLVPHLQRSIRLGFRFEGYQALQQAHHDALDRLATGVLLLDRQGKVIFANAAARAWTKGPLTLRARELAHEDPFHDRRLRDMVQGVLRGEEMMARSIPDAWDEPPLVVMASSVRGRDRDRLHDHYRGDAALMLFVARAGGGAEAPEEWLRDAFGLTSTEARVAMAIARGQGVVEVARRFRVSPNTVKTHLQRVFGKTGTRSQVGLARLLIPIGLMAGGPVVGGRA